MTQKGLNAEKLGLTELAEGYYRQAIKEEPESAGLAMLRLGILLEEKEYFSEAAELLGRPMVRQTHHEPQLLSEAAAHQAVCLTHLNLMDSALHCASRAIEADTGSWLAMTVMAYVESHRDEHVNAIAWARRARQAAEKLGIRNEESGMRNEELGTVSGMTLIGEARARCENMMGYVLYRKGNESEAMRHFKLAIKADSTLADAYFNLGTMHCQRNSPMSAIKVLKEGLRRNARNVRLYTALATAYRQMDEDAKALECYNQILKYDSLHTPTLNRIGTLYCHQGHYERAISFHKRVLNIRPEDASAYKYIGKAYLEWGKEDKAIQSFIRATNLCSTDPETYMYLAELYGKQKKGERKQQNAYKKAARLGEKEAQAWLVKRGLSW